MLGRFSISEAEIKRRRVKSPCFACCPANAQFVPPVWMMRQAGRYLPEYREVRARAGGFLDLCFNPELAAEVTLQPIRRFGFDAAILFSDILVIPHALGQTVTFVEGEGPRLNPLTNAAALNGLRREADQAILAPIYETVRRVKAQLDDRVTLIGFCGAPWTVATYMVAGRGTPDQGPAREFAVRDPLAFGATHRQSCRCVSPVSGPSARRGRRMRPDLRHLGRRTAARRIRSLVRTADQAAGRQGSRAVSGRKDHRLPARRGRKIPRYVDETGVDAVSLESGIDRKFAAVNIQSRVPVQGNVDPERVVGWRSMRWIGRSMTSWRPSPHAPFVFNLGHGVLPKTPVAHVERMLERVRRQRAV